MVDNACYSDSRRNEISTRLIVSEEILLFHSLLFRINTLKHVSRRKGKRRSKINALAIIYIDS